MKVTMIGTGYVGLVSGTCFAEMGHQVTCIDIDPDKISLLQKGESPIFEPGLSDLLKLNIKSGRLHFSTSYESVAQAQCVFLAVGTPSRADGRADLQYLEQAAEQIAPYLADEALVVIKSTVPVGTHQKIKECLLSQGNKKFHVVNNPEFLKEGSAVSDFMKPDRVVIGCESDTAREVMEELYRPLMLQGNPIYSMSNLSAEMTKYASNCYLATKISFINEIARLCDATGADVNEVRKGMSSDQRIGHHFLYPGVGYGGSCFPKDVQALMATGEDFGVETKIIRAAHQTNEEQKLVLLEKIKRHFDGDLAGRVFSFWGLAFKPNTDDVREAPALILAQKLIEQGAKIQVFDPIATENFLKCLPSGESIRSFEDKYDALVGADALCLLTEWNQFRAPDFAVIKNNLKSPVLFDGRNLYPTQTVQDHGFSYYAIGKWVP